MFCKKCGKQIKDGMLFCTNCGMKVTIPQAEINAPQKKMVVPASIEREKPKEKGPIPTTPKSEVQKLHILTIAIGVLIVIIVALVYIIFFSKPGKKEDETPQEYEETMANLRNEPEEVIPHAQEPTPIEEPVQEESTAEPEEPASQYFLPESNSRYMTMQELEGFTAADCRLARNELYARHGRRFNDENLQAHFDSCEWYQGTIAPEDFDESVLNEYELANRDLIVQYESVLEARGLKGTITYTTHEYCIYEYELKDGILTVKADEGANASGFNTCEPFAFSYPVADDCIWEDGPGFGSRRDFMIDIAPEDVEKAIRDWRDWYDSDPEDIQSPVGIQFQIVDGQVVGVYTYTS